MVKIQSILALCATLTSSGLDAAAAGECHPAYIPGTAYSVGTWVSSSFTSITPITYTECSPPGSDSCPPTGFIQEGGVTSTASYNYECHSEYWCSARGYSPDSIYAEYAWTKESTECTGTATLAPTPGDVGNTASPTQSPIFVSLTDQGGCPAEFNDSSNYEEGDKVSVNGIVFQCQAWPNSLFCNQSGFEPDLDSALENWKQAWLVLGYCSGTLAPSTSIPTSSTVTIAPTLSPSFPATTDSPTSANVGGCPIVWAAGGSMTYKENDEVSVIESSGTGRKAVYKCKAWPASAYCGQFSPIDLNGGKLGWEYVGGCVGTITPTSSPTYDASSVIAGCPVAYTATSSTYQAGDKVSRTVSTTPLRKQVYQCRDWPGSVYCNQKTFAPGTEFDYMAWTVLGPCEGTLAPTAAPTSYGGLCTYEKVVVDAPPTPTPVAEWSLGTSYEAGDQVRIGLAKFECKPWPYYFWCRVASYAPTLSDTGSWTEAWTPAGDCDP